MVFNTGSEVINQEIFSKNAKTFREKKITFPKISELAYPVNFFTAKATELSKIDPDYPDAKNLLRFHWYNGEDRRTLVKVPEHIVLGPEITGIETKIIIILGNRFPLIRAHKVLTAYGCILPSLLNGTFDASWHRAIWPSTGNYCRGGIAISRILGCRGVAVLPEGMSAERFEWLEHWIENPSDIIRTPGTESNVKEIYDKCNALNKDPQNVILNQFSEFGNYIVHRAVTGPAIASVFDAANIDDKLQPRAFIAASGSAGTLAAGDFLKKTLGTDICVVEALECPTLLYNGYGEHNIQGIGDKHVPLIHNVMNTDFVIGVSSFATDNLNLLFNNKEGKKYIFQRTGATDAQIADLSNLGFSAIANILAAIKYSKYMGLGKNDAILTVATDGAELYSTELALEEQKLEAGNLSQVKAAEIFGRYLLATSTDHMIELDRYSRERIFNLGYYTWVEQQGISANDFDIRRNQSFWDNLMKLVPEWDQLLENFNTSK